ncbi:MAG: DinB family protein [Caldilineaceae bacterium]|nr:DinB family protein [Caldilineaceae bacterium]
MLDFQAVRDKRLTMEELVRDLTIDDLRQHTNEMVDTMLGLIAEATDADVVFEPEDAQADDPYATTSDAVNMPWTLGHVIVHTTASAEESAFLAAELARGVEHHGRSRYEVPWETVTTIEQCRQRLEESRRMRLASLELWPAAPHYENRYAPRAGATPINCVVRFVNGLRHDAGHLEQIAAIVKQARAARVAV